MLDAAISGADFLRVTDARRGPAWFIWLLGFCVIVAFVYRRIPERQPSSPWGMALVFLRVLLAVIAHHPEAVGGALRVAS
jgi:uncharacterized membrane protein YecN with MAPEG domain